jgi:hypothetical protein
MEQEWLLKIAEIKTDLAAQLLKMAEIKTELVGQKIDTDGRWREIDNRLRSIEVLMARFDERAQATSSIACEAKNKAERAEKLALFGTGAGGVGLLTSTAKLIGLI